MIDGNEVKKPNTWDWGVKGIRPTNLLLFDGLKFNGGDKNPRNSLLKKLEEKVQSLQNSCHEIGTILCNATDADVDRILKFVDYWSPLKFIEVLTHLLERTNEVADFWLAQRSCDMLQNHLKRFNRFKKIVNEGSQLVPDLSISDFESTLFEVFILFVRVAYMDSAVLTGNELIEVS